ncbi:heterokaryon incompatibility protein-domain-containing protein, partial [Stachybotrys elegans]
MESDSTFNQARGWLKTCIEQHEGCKSSVHQDFIPTRLLHITGSFDKPIELVEKGDIPADVSYATLSHCWGQNVLHSLTTLNFDDLKSGISRSSICKTFVDAIKVAQELGLSYLWIDSLCIIQDSTKDWNRESVQMHNIYGKSTYNIAATSAKNGSVGCFRRREPSLLRPSKLHFDKDWRLSAEHTDGKNVLYLTDVDEWWRRFDQEPLLQRAWVVQERALSPRVLHYEWDQLVWECNHLTASERYPNGLDKLTPSHKPKLRQQVDAERRIAQEKHIPGLALKDIWRPALEAYTATAITKNSDRLVALHGVGMRIQEAFGWDYVAGMFPTNNLVSQMLWRPKGTGIARRPDIRIAPSWSWVSI